MNDNKKRNRGNHHVVAASPGAGSGAPRAWIVAVVLAVSIGIVYGRALDAPLIFDDDAAISGNVSIRSLWPLVGTTGRPGPLNPTHDLPTSSRPLVNLSFAVNYYFAGLQPVGYHVANAVIHFGAALLLWAIVRRTLLLPYFAGRFASSAGWLALAAAMLWAQHPLATEAVIYATQRTELMMALFYLATLYCSLRYWSLLPPPLGEGRGEGAVEANRNRRRRATWLLLAVLACLCGMASKQVMVSAPLMTLLFDRTFVAGSLGKALRRSWPLYVGLAATWILLLVLHPRVQTYSTAGFGIGVPAYAWWLTQTKVFLMYLKLVVWPYPLLIHYQLPYFVSLSEAWMFAVPVLLLGIFTLVLLWRNNPVGYLLTAVFAVLSPTFAIPITTEMAAERRMYLPLAVLVVLFVAGAYWLAEWALGRRATGRQTGLGLRSPLVAIALPVILLTLVFGVASAKRLAAYDDEMGLWQEVVQLQPRNYMAHSSIGRMLKTSGRLPEAIAEYQIALKLNPKSRLVHNNLGVAYLHASRLPEAVEELQAALAIDPDYPVALNNLGIALARQGRHSEAVEHLEHAVRLRPEYASAHNNLGLTLGGLGKIPEAIEHLQLALELGDDDFNSHNNLGRLLVQAGDFKEATAHFERAVELQPNRADIQNNLGEALRRSGRPQEAITHCQAALQLDPKFLQGYADLALAFAAFSRSTEAIATAEQGIKVAQDAGQSTAVEQFQELLARFRTGPERNERAAAQSRSPPKE